MPHSHQCARALKYLRSYAHPLGVAPNFRACVDRKVQICARDVGVHVALLILFVLVLVICINIFAFKPILHVTQMTSLACKLLEDVSH